MHKSTIKLINNTEWLSEESTLHLQLDGTKYPYEIIERIFLAVSCKEGYNWRTVYRATQQTPFIYPYLVVSLLLIRKFLVLHYSYDANSIQKLLGIEHYSILLEYDKFN